MGVQVGPEYAARQVANQIALKNAVDEYGVHRIFTFHSSVASAKSFTSEGGEGVNSELPDFLAVHVNGAMPAAKRSHIMREFEQADQAVISNARCLTEGVDVPAVDMVAFLSPKKSKVDIVQATGRAMRKSAGKDVGYVLVPLYLEQEKDESLEEAVKRADFSEIWNLLQAMKEQDEDLADVIKVIQEERGKTGGYDDSRLREHIEVLGPALNLATLRNAVVTQCVRHVGNTWDLRYGELVAYKEEYGNCNVPHQYLKNPSLGPWVNTQRKSYKKGELDPARVRRLEDVDFVWDTLSVAWDRWFQELVEFKKANNNCNVPSTYQQNPQLAKWVNRQRNRYKSGKLEQHRVNRLETIGFIWDPFDAAWWESYHELLGYKEKYGTCNVTHGSSDYPELAKWVSRQRVNYKKGQLEHERIERLEQIGFNWDPLGAAWEEMYADLVAYKEKHGHCDVPGQYPENQQLGRWVNRQRMAYKKGGLNQDRIKRLEKIGFLWDTLEAEWEKKYLELLRYLDENRTSNAPTKFPENPALGTWVDGC